MQAIRKTRQIMIMKFNAVSLFLLLTTGPMSVMSLCGTESTPAPPDANVSEVVDLCRTISPIQVTVTNGIPDILYAFGGVGEAGRTYTFSTCFDSNVAIDTSLSVFDGFFSDAALLVCNDDEGTCPLQTELTFLVPNEQFQVLLLSVFDGGNGVVTLAWDDVDGGCMVDPDRDGIVTGLDNCPFVPNAGQEDFDNDGVGDVCDNCVEAFNPQQEDFNNDGVGDACSDVDIDGVLDSVDNCREVFNPLQEDSNGDGVGDACSKGKKGSKKGMGSSKKGMGNSKKGMGMMKDKSKKGMSDKGMKKGSKKGMSDKGMGMGNKGMGNKGMKGDMKMKGKM
jgi:hypothetical protein